MKNLIDICQYRPMQMAIFTHGEQVLEAALGHLEDGVFDGCKFPVNIRLYRIQQSKSDHAS